MRAMLGFSYLIYTSCYGESQPKWMAGIIGLGLNAGTNETVAGRNQKCRFVWLCRKLKGVEVLLLSYLLVLSYAKLVVAEMELFPHILQSPAQAPSIYPLAEWNHSPSGIAPISTKLPLPVIIPLTHRPQRKHFFAYNAHSSVPAPTHPPHYASLRTSHHHSSGSSGLLKQSMQHDQNLEPKSGHLPPANLFGIARPPFTHQIFDCCGPGMVPRQGSRLCHCVYPIKLQLLLLNTSFSANWGPKFLKELASQLRLQVCQFQITHSYLVGRSGLNITMDVVPHSRISFSSSDAHKINSSLSMHKIHLDATLVGEYRLLNFTWFKPHFPSPAPAFISSTTLAPDNVPFMHPPAKKRKYGRLILILAVGFGLLIGIVMFMLIIWLCTSHKVKKKEPAKRTVKRRTGNAVSADASLPRPTNMRLFSYEELRQATNNFERACMLGEGGFGQVFQGLLSDGTPVAIKKLTCRWHQGNKEFLVEVEMLSRLHHRNLVKLLGFYSCQGSSQHLLCYELVPNGNLEAWLHGPLGVNCPLDWDTRMKIALDAARGLAYLHEDSQPRVIHRDFKASNILLDNDFHAKVGDFGLAREAPEGHANFLSTRVMGTFGYLAPEYAMTGRLMLKSDVYSYGVVLLELLTGRKPVDMSLPSGQGHLVTWAQPILQDKDRLEELADPRLPGNYPGDDFLHVCTIAAACVALEPRQRPTMGKVVQSLKLIMEFQGSCAARCNLGQSSTAYGSSEILPEFSSGPSFRSNYV